MYRFFAFEKRRGAASKRRRCLLRIIVIGSPQTGKGPWLLHAVSFIACFVYSNESLVLVLRS